MKYVAAFLFTQSFLAYVLSIQLMLNGGSRFESAVFHFLGVLMLGVGALVGKKAMEQTK